MIWWVLKLLGSGLYYRPGMVLSLMECVQITTGLILA
jgi:hypothetical protein